MYPSRQPAGLQSDRPGKAAPILIRTRAARVVACARPLRLPPVLVHARASMRVLASTCVAVAAAAAAGARASDCNMWLPMPPAVPTLVASTGDPAWQAAVVFPDCTVETVVVGSTNKDLTFLGTTQRASLEAVVSVPTELEAISFDQIGWFTAANFTNAKRLKSLRVQGSCRNARLPIINNSTLPESITSLSMISNEIVSLKSATLPPALEDLNLGLNNITKIDFELPKTLKTLVLSNNRITALDRVSFPSTLQVLVLKNTNITVVRGTRFPKSLTSLQIEPWIISTFEIQETDFTLLSKISFLSINASQTSCDEPSAQIKTLVTNSFCVISDAKFTELYGAQTPEPATQAPQLAKDKSNSVVVIVVVCVATILVLGCGFVAYRVYTRSQARRRKQKESQVGEGYVLEQASSGSKPPGVSGGGSDGAQYLYNDVRNDPTLLPLRLNEQEVELKESLAHGGFGVVYRAIYRGHQVAIKRVLPELSQDASKLTRFMDEIRLCASLDHPKIVAFKGICWTSLRDLSAVIEYMPGGDLYNVLSRETSTPSPSNWMESWTPAHINAKSLIALDVAEAVVYLHSFSSPILHRDLKARNVLLDERGNAKLSDFGISRELSLEETMTRGIGTVAWMAPEVLMGERYTEKADIYSLGVLLVELDCCRDPYADQLQDGQPISETQLAVLVSQGEIRPALSVDAPESVRWLVDQCLSFDALSRPSAMAVFYALHQICRAVNEHE